MPFVIIFSLFFLSKHDLCSLSSFQLTLSIPIFLNFLPSFLVLLPCVFLPISACLPVCLFVCLSVCLSVCLPFCMCLSACSLLSVSVSRTVCVTDCWFYCLSIMSVCLSVCLCCGMSVHLSI